MRLHTEHPHDALFRHVFAEPSRAAELAHLALPPALVAAIDWATLVTVPARVVAADLDQLLDWMAKAALVTDRAEVFRN